MTESRWLPALCFGLGCAGSLAASCSDLQSDGCSCPEQPEQPQVEGVFPVRSVVASGSGPLEPAPGVEAGTVMVTDSELTFSYSSEGSEYTVKYAIGEPQRSD
jgi:hypothetical protein